MSAMKELTVAVDIGTAKTIAVIGRYTADQKLDIVGLGVVDTQGVRNGMVQNVEQTGLSIKNAVGAAAKGLKMNVRSVYAGISGQKIRTRSVDGYRMIERNSEVTPRLVQSIFDEVQRYAPQTGEMIYHVVPQEYLVDGEGGIQQPVGMAGNRIDARYNLILAPKAYHQNLQRSVEKAGFNLEGVFINPYVQGEVFLTEDEKEAGVILVDLGAGTTGVSLYYENRLRLAAELPFGGNVVSNDIKEGCHIIRRHAELLKVNYGYAMGELAPDNKVVQIPEVDGWPAKEVSFKNLSHIIEARMCEIIDGVNYLINQSGLVHKLGAGIVLTGGGAHLKGIDNLVSYHTGLAVRFGKPIVSFERQLFNEHILTPESATILGLLTQGLIERSSVKNSKPMVERQESEPQKRKHPHREPSSPGFKGKMQTIFERMGNGFESLIADDDDEF